MKKKLSILLLISMAISCQSFPEQESDQFKHYIIDEEIPGQRVVVDIDGDQMPDIFVAVDYESEKPIGLYWYSYPSWERFTIREKVNFRADDLESGDIDNDGDMDLIVTTDEDGKVFWYENPRPKKDPRKSDWIAHQIGVSGTYVKDVEVADLDNSGYVDVAIRCEETLSIFKQVSKDKWKQLNIDIPPKEGMDVGDLDGDGDLDIVLNGYWLETPEDILNNPWIQHTIDVKWFNQNTGAWQDNCSNVVVSDMNRDGKNDVLLCHSENNDWPISWYENNGGTQTKWIEHRITERYNYCETLEVYDMDNDGDLDVIAGEMKKSSRYGDVTLFANTGSSDSWVEKIIAKRVGIYNGKVADIDNDGDWDIVGCRDYNKAPIEWWNNQIADEKNWKYIEVDNNRPKSQFGKMGLIFNDVNKDGYQDIVAGSYLYFNPGGDLSHWQRQELPKNVDVYFAIDVDDDPYSDLIGVSDGKLLWIEAKNPEANSFSVTTIGSVPEGRTQGYTLADVIPGGKKELVFTRDHYLFYVVLPEKNPEKGNWTIVTVSEDVQEEGVAAGDIDRDGDIDLAAYASDGHHVVWLENPGNGMNEWPRHEFGSSNQWLDRIVLVDINQDGRLDVVSTEESQDWLYNSSVFWFEAPRNPKSGKWARHTIGTLRSLNSMDIGDFNGDGSVDIVVAEHTDQKTSEGAPDNLTIVYMNFDNGKRWVTKIINRGKHSSHLGARICDLDNDGDSDIVSIAWKQFEKLHLFRNLSIQK